MKKVLVACVFVLSLCFGEQKIIIGSTPTPYGEILEFAKPLFEKSGCELIHKEFADYITPNIALSEDELDANLFQHEPFMNEYNANKKADLVSLGTVVLVPMAVYSKKIKDLKELKNGATIALPNDPTNESRSLDLLAKAGLISFESDTSFKTPLDIKQNPKNLRFKELKAAQTPRALDDVDLSAITTNYALGVGLNPLKDGLLIEDKASKYAIILAVREKNKDNEKSKIIKEILQSKEVADFVKEKFAGSVIPVNE